MPQEAVGLLDPPAAPGVARTRSAPSVRAECRADSRVTEADAGLPASRAFPLFAAGVHFGLLQTALFFVIQIHVTATYMGYFAVVLAWMLGVVLNMRVGVPAKLSPALTGSAAAYFLLLSITSVIIPYGVLLPVCFLLVVVTALPAGALFRVLAPTIPARSLFLHENNGFILGLALGMFGFVKWGVNFLYLAPLLSYGMTLLSRSHAAACAFVVLPVTAFVSLWMGNSQAFWTLGAITVFGIVSYWIRLRPVTGRGSGEGRNAAPALSRTASRTVLALSGCNLILLQYFITREFSTVLAATELAILVVGIAYFAGYSIGYFVSQRVPPAALRVGAFAMFFLHLVILLFSKVCAGHLIHAGFGLTTLVGMLFVVSFCTASFYSMLLPRLIRDADLSLVSGYSWDLLGAVGGTGVMFLLTTLAPALLQPVYFLMMLIVILLLLRRSPWRPGIALIGVAVVAALIGYQRPWRTYATEDYYRTRGYDHPKLLFQGNSFYHSVEVLDTFRDAGRTVRQSRTSFINGVRYFRHIPDPDGNRVGRASLEEFTYFLAELPAKYVHAKTGRKLRVLILGGGSMSTIYRVHPYATRTTLVEIDPLVIEAAKACWADLNHYDRIRNYEVVLDDAVRYLRTTDEKFDLIVNDISAPYYLGTALLHGKEYYALVASRLKRDGLFAESTQGRPRPSRTQGQAMKILRGVADVFPHYRVVDCRGASRGRHGYIYATNRLKLSTDALTDFMKKDGAYKGTATYWEGSSRFPLHRVRPFSLTNMETLLSGNVRRIKNRLNIGDRGSRRVPSFSEYLRRMSDPADPLYSRLLHAIRGKAASPAFLGVAGLIVGLAFLLRWTLPRWSR